MRVSATNPTIPTVLLDSRGSISTARALRQIKDLLEQYPLTNNPAAEDRIAASLDDIETMLANIAH